MFELTIIEEFEAAHRLPEYDGKCCRLHGHNWRVEVVVRGTELDSSGLLIDFKILKTHVADVLSTLDHYYLNETAPFHNVPPTAEYIAKYIYETLAAQADFDDRVKIFAVRIWESPRSCASYIPGE
jgi:6-pyruvoyltetrahydropterin/6-carboxytetrahydropterin synthase